ncbi:MAG: hypothetical protein ACFFDF_00900 [Candidatus Odinarchaeota archaeon]
MMTWKIHLKFDPLLILRSTKNKAILHFIKKDLLDEEVKSNKLLWKLPEVGKILKKQNSDGSWKYPSSKKDLRTQENYNQLETYRQLGFLIEKYAFNNLHPAIRNASDYLFSFQTKEGDFRGIYGTQYSPNYSAGIMELLIKSGYDKDPRIEKGLK